MTEIVKVQRPLMTNGDEPVWLVYGKGRKNMKIWIDGFWRGDPAHGVVLHRYLARKKVA
jgi:hypothetical protein